MSTIQEAVAKRRTFAIISHPDAGKTTLTEKLLLYSGMLRTAGMVKGRKGRKAAASDWMAMEQERGISITSSAMQFSYKDTIINVLDTPGHEDFSEDTYRTLTAADCAIMVIDAGKGVEKQTRKLFEVCRLRKIPVLTFINKMDMPGREPLELMNEVENVLQIQSYAMNWPIGTGRDFQGVFDRKTNECIFFTKTSIGGAQKADIERVALKEAKPRISDQLLEELDLLEMAGNAFSQDAFLRGEVTPVFFASALTNFGVEPFFDAFIHLAPCPGPRLADLPNGGEILIDPIATPFSGYIFKLQANMDRRHRDSMAFIRICSGKFERDLVVKHHRLNREIRLSRPHGMVAGERTTLDVAYAGDVIGVINPGLFAIGDTLSLTGGFNFKPLPKFQPEIFAKLYPKDVGKRKAFDKGLLQLVSEGAIQMLRSFEREGEYIFAAVGQLQFEVMQYRLKDEYGVETILTPLPYQCSAWVVGDMGSFAGTSTSTLVLDKEGRPMALFNSPWDKQYCIRQNPKHQFVDVLV
ncbi:MAG: peptide chain release factor 3 [Chlamydiae bacterium RIFCSPHIGHO2_12_FULL_49_9]|nr:MAG: peptide chain release factor 3 [Chlamydiae bacterium RIFCSPHIGHO2_12_FULL_49_9]